MQPNIQSSKLPNLITGGCHTDARGTLRFCNDFDMSAVKRFYTISNSAAQPKRGWIMHKRETKWFFPLRGVTKIETEPSTVDLDLQPRPSPTTYTLDASHPSVLMVPLGNWFLIEQSEGPAEIQVFSNCCVGEFNEDDYRK